MTLTSRQREVLFMLASAEDAGEYEEAEIVCDRGVCWVGLEKISRRTVRALLVNMLISLEEGGSIERYTINGTGRAVYHNPGQLAIVQKAIREGTKLTITADDRIIELR